ncbi:hypothetical protein ABGB12_13045 [Actinocorallia sp. B10E7]|uniref:hypothetical protein n=1 Tax=Actinocorallia sp. B10E7 TaxID=3153558 RepID=UPI00325CFA0A
MKVIFNRRPRRIVATLVAAVGSLVGSVVGVPAAHAATSCSNYSSATSTCVNQSISIGGTSYSTDWYFPNTTPTALMLAEHGFSRGCGNLRGTSKAIAEKGVAVLCINASMTGGNPTLAATVGDALSARTITPPSGHALPVNYIVGGHSAGGHFASAVGKRLADNGYAAFKGAILFDPVAANSSFTTNLQAISNGATRPVLSIAARPATINSSNNSFGALASLGAGFVGIQLLWTGYSGTSGTGASCHVDVEGENTNWLGTLAAGCSPTTTNTARLRDFASTWAKDLATGAHTTTHYCTDSDTLATCGATTYSLVGGTLPLAAVIPNS